MRNYQNDIERYIRGEMSAEEMHALEKRALNDPFLADALEGAGEIDSEDFITDVSSLSTRIHRKSKREAPFWVIASRIAAGFVLLLAASYLIWSFYGPEKESELALEKPKEIHQESESSIQESDSIVSDGDRDAEPVIEDNTNETKELINTEKNQLAQAGIKKQKSIKPSESSKSPIVETVPTEDDEKITLPVTEEKPQPLIAETKDVTQQAERDKETAAQSRSLSKKAKVDVSEQKAEAPTASGFTTTNRIIKGKVTSGDDGSRLPGVNVIVKGTTTGTVTDVNGEYQLNVNNPNTTLVFSFIGLQSIEVPANDDEVDVQLSGDVAQLSEVVVTGYATTRSQEGYTPTVDLTHPENGYRQFKKYLEENIQYPAEAISNKIDGRVTVEFFVETDGSLTDFSVVRGIGYGCDEELIRLIKEGPRWIPTLKDNVAVKDKARVRLKFNLPK